MKKDERPAVSVVGLGDMGGALATALCERGCRVTVWNRDARKSRPLVEKGARLAARVAEAVTASPSTIVCVSDYAATMDILSTSDATAALAGRTLLQFSTTTSAESIALSEWSERAGATYLCGQILAYPDDIRKARANIVVSGSKDVFERHAELLRTMAGIVNYVGDHAGAAPAFARAHDSFVVGSYLAFLQGAALCARSGIDLRRWCDFNLSQGVSSAVTNQLSILAGQVCGRTYEEGLGATTAVWRGTIEKIIEECDALGAGKGHLEPLARLVAAATEGGLGSKELGILFEGMRNGPPLVNGDRRTS